MNIEIIKEIAIKIALKMELSERDKGNSCVVQAY